MMLQVSVVLSIVLGFLSSEFLGLLSGGMVSAGYLAFYLQQPLRVLSTLIMAIIICLLVKFLQRYIILFGRRRFMLVVVLGILLSMLFEKCLVFFVSFDQDFRLIGYIITGLIANDMVKQGIFKTLAMVLIISIIIWLVIHLGVF